MERPRLEKQQQQQPKPKHFYAQDYVICDYTVLLLPFQLDSTPFNSYHRCPGEAPSVALMTVPRVNTHVWSPRCPVGLHISPPPGHESSQDSPVAECHHCEIVSDFCQTFFLYLWQRSCGFWLLYYCCFVTFSGCSCHVAIFAVCSEDQGFAMSHLLHWPGLLWGAGQ